MSEVEFRSFNTHILGDILPNKPTQIYVPPTKLNILQKNLIRFDNKISSGRSLSDEELHQMNLKKQEDNETLSYGRFHIVKEEDTFEDIARERGISVTDLLAWNNLSTEDTLEIGLQLKLTAPKENVGFHTK